MGPDTVHELRMLFYMKYLFLNSRCKADGLRPAFAEPKHFSRWASWSRPLLMQPKWPLDTTCFKHVSAGDSWSHFFFLLDYDYYVRLFREVVRIYLKEERHVQCQEMKASYRYPAHSC